VVLAWIDHADGKNEEAIKLLQEIAAKEEGIFAPDGGIPAHEMLGDMLMEMNSPRRALKEYESELRLNPNRFDSLSGAALAGRSGRTTKNRRKVLCTTREGFARGGNSQRPELLRARSVLAASGQMGRQQSEFQIAASFGRQLRVLSRCRNEGETLKMPPQVAKDYR